MGTASYISYHTINGRIRSGACTTTSKFECRWDALGSVVRTTQYNSPNGSSRRYAAYGTPLQKYNYYSDFRMGWVGSFGYRRTVNPHAEQYIRARHYSYTDARWITKDPLWPNEPAYEYDDVSQIGLPLSMPSEFSASCSVNSNKVPGEFGLGCSIGRTSGISADFKIPSHCDLACKSDYINFYLSMAGHEGGISFTDERKGGKPGWQGFLNEEHGLIQHISVTGLIPGATVSMSLLFRRGKAIFTVKGHTIRGTTHAPTSSTARTVSAAGPPQNKKCPPAYSIAMWSNVRLHGGNTRMNHKAFVNGDTKLIQNYPLATSLRNAKSSCDLRQFDDPYFQKNGCKKCC